MLARQLDFMIERMAMAAQPINESVAGHLGQKRPELFDCLKSPSRLAKAFDQIDPNRLNNIGRVKLRPQ